MKNRDIHAFPEFSLHQKALGSLDILKIDAAKGRFKRGNGIHQLVHIGFINFNIKHVNIGKLLEQNRLAFHYGFGGQWADIAQSQHSGAIRNDSHQVAPCCDIRHFCRVFYNGPAGIGNTRRIGLRKVALVGEWFGWANFDFSRNGVGVVTQGTFFE